MDPFNNPYNGFQIPDGWPPGTVPPYYDPGFYSQGEQIVIQESYKNPFYSSDVNAPTFDPFGDIANSNNNNTLNNYQQNGNFSSFNSNFNQVNYSNQQQPHPFENKFETYSNNQFNGNSSLNMQFQNQFSQQTQQFQQQQSQQFQQQQFQHQSQNFHQQQFQQQQPQQFQQQYPQQFQQQQPQQFQQQQPQQFQQQQPQQFQQQQPQQFQQQQYFQPNQSSLQSQSQLSTQQYTQEQKLQTDRQIKNNNNPPLNQTNLQVQSNPEQRKRSQSQNNPFRSQIEQQKKWETNYSVVTESLKGLNLEEKTTQHENPFEKHNHSFNPRSEINKSEYDIYSSSKSTGDRNKPLPPKPSTNIKITFSESKVEETPESTTKTMYTFRASWRDPSAFVMSTKKPIDVLSTQKEFVLKIIDKDDKSLIIEKKNGHPGSMSEVLTSSLSDMRYIRRYTAYGVLGIVALQAPYESKDPESFLILVTGVEIIGRITNIPVYKITQVQFASFNPQSETAYASAKKTPFDDMKRFCENGDFYFSYDYDLTHSLQRIHVKREIHDTLQTTKAADRRFFWNRYLARYFIRKELDDYLVIVIRGTVNVSERLYISHNSKVDFALISRIGCLRAGTRYNARGINDNGDVGNFVETEQIIATDDYISSFVQIRGSVPVFWEEPFTKSGHTLTLTRSAEASSVAFQKHFRYLNYHYGKIHIVNLLGHKKKEADLTHAYEDQLVRWKGMTKDDVSYTHFDFHNECSGQKFKNVSRLYQFIREDLEKFKSFIYERSTGNILQLQTGSMRTNCLDCLDRTNVTQTFISQTVLEKQLEFMFKGGNISIQGNLMNTFKEFWANNGDALSKAYTGTGAMKSSFTRKGKSTLSGLIDDGMKSVTRFYINTFKDPNTQICVDLFLGKIEEYVEEDISIEDGWVRAQMRKRESEFTTYKNKKVFVGSFNCNANCITSIDEMDKWIGDIKDMENIDIWVFGFQEIVELKASQVFSAKTTTSKNWDSFILAYLNSKRSQVVKLQSQQLVGLYITIFVAEKELNKYQNVQVCQSKVGFKGMSGNKGAVSISLQFYDTSLCFICSHLSAGPKKFNLRISDYRIISQQVRFGATSLKRAKKIDDHDFVFWFGDLNFRINLPYEQTLSSIYESNIDYLLIHDEFNRAKKDRLAFNDYNEAPIQFYPTYKVDIGSKQYDSSEKKRVPSWTDRILYKTPQNHHINCQLYNSSDLLISDHLPIKAVFEVSVKEMDKVKASTIENELYEKSKEYDIDRLEKEEMSLI